MTTAVRDALSSESQGFRRARQPAYGCAEAVADRLRPGSTGGEAARTQRPWPLERAGRDRFHLPFAWFGDRTAFVWSTGASFFERGGVRRWAEDR